MLNWAFWEYIAWCLGSVMKRNFWLLSFVWYSIQCFGCNLLKVQADNFPRSPANCVGTRFVFFGEGDFTINWSGNDHFTIIIEGDLNSIHRGKGYQVELLQPSRHLMNPWVSIEEFSPFHFYCWKDFRWGVE